MKSIYLYILTGILLFLQPGISEGQEDTLRIETTLDQQMVSEKHLWLNSMNAAGLKVYSVRDHNNFDLHYRSEEGAFRKTMTPSGLSQYGMHTSGYKGLNFIDFQGSFRYNRNEEKKVEWMAMMDPNRSNPFLLADSIGGNWKKDYYTLQMKMGTDQGWDALRLGLSAKYQVAQGGRDNDPRPKSTIKDLSLSPGLVWDIVPSHHLGMAYHYHDYRQDVDIMNKYGVGGNVLYKIMGLALLEQPLVKPSVEYRIDSWSHGASLQYNARTNPVDLLTEWSYRLIHEKGVQYPYRAMQDPETGEILSMADSDIRFSEKIYDALIQATFGKEGIMHKIILKGTVAEGKTFDVSTEQVEFIQDRTSAKVEYHLFNQPAGLHVRFHSGYRQNAQENLFYGTRDIESLEFRASGEKEFTLLQIDFASRLTLGCAYNIGSKLNIDPQSDFINETYDITNPYVRNNYAFLTSGYYFGQAGVTYYHPLNRKTRLFVDLNAGYYAARSSGDFNGTNRMTINSRIGILF